MLSLTPQERQVIVFLVLVALLGTGVNFFLKINAKARPSIAVWQDIGRIDINTADREVLMSLSGIGTKLAGRIIEYRNSHGGFKDAEELKNIKGINENKYEKIKDSLCAR